MATPAAIISAEPAATGAHLSVGKLLPVVLNRPRFHSLDVDNFHDITYRPESPFGLIVDNSKLVAGLLFPREADLLTTGLAQQASPLVRHAFAHRAAVLHK